MHDVVSVSEAIGLPEVTGPCAEVGVIEERVTAGVTYAYINDPNQKGAPHVHTMITD